jgi:hypothetical protein
MTPMRHTDLTAGVLHIAADLQQRQISTALGQIRTELIDNFASAQQQRFTARLLFRQDEPQTPLA